MCMRDIKKAKRERERERERERAWFGFKGPQQKVFDDYTLLLIFMF